MEPCTHIIEGNKLARWRTDVAGRSHVEELVGNLKEYRRLRRLIDTEIDPAMARNLEAHRQACDKEA